MKRPQLLTFKMYFSSQSASFIQCVEKSAHRDSTTVQQRN